MTMKVRALLVGSVLLAEMWLVGCGHYNCKETFGATSGCTSSGGGVNQGNGGSSTQKIFVYFLNDERAQFAGDAMDFNNSHSFAQIPNFVGPTIDQNQSQFARDGGIAILNKKYLYVPFVDGKLFGFSIDPTSAALTAIAGTPMDLSLPPDIPSPIAADPGGNFIFVADSTGVFVFSINQSTGALTMVTGSPFAASGLQPTSAATDGLGKYLYVADGTQISQFSYSASTGALTSLGTLTSNMSLLVSESTGKFILGSTQEVGSGGGPSDNHVYAFSISSTAVPGSLTAVNAAGFPTTKSVAWMAVTPNGKFLYTFNENDTNQNNPLFEAIEGFSLAGLPSQLPALAGSPFVAFDSNFGRIDQSGNYMIVNGQESIAPVAGTFPIQIQSDGTLSSDFPATGSAGLFAITDEP
jgi:6-phosphogluconolactonase (cycloisomerase 2 family)